MNLFHKKRHHYKVFIVSATLIFMGFGFTRPMVKEIDVLTKEKEIGTASISRVSFVVEKLALYDSLDLGALGLTREAFVYGVTGFKNLLDDGKVVKDNILSILDFSLPSGKKRLFVIDLEAGELVYHTYASHGKKSGQTIPTKFSNKTNSNQSSLGFYVTGDTYRGKHGESLRLLGEERGINDNAFKRGIVMHSASYVDEDIIERQGFIGRSQGCPALPKNIYKDVIDKIKEGSCLFIYSPDKFYVTHSKMIHEKA
ncbi:MAG: murein L,D-transpeptidase catalytic domain family protein [Bacteroidota bacterium]